MWNTYEEKFMRGRLFLPMSDSLSKAHKFSLQITMFGFKTLEELLIKWNFVFEGSFSMFWGAKKFLKFFQKYFNNRIEKLHKMAFIIFFYFV